MHFQPFCDPNYRYKKRIILKKCFKYSPEKNNFTHFSRMKKIYRAYYSYYLDRSVLILINTGEKVDHQKKNEKTMSSLDPLCFCTFFMPP